MKKKVGEVDENGSRESEWWGSRLRDGMRVGKCSVGDI